MIEAHYIQENAENLKALQQIDFLELPEEKGRFEIKFLCQLQYFEQIMTLLSSKFSLISYNGECQQHYENLYFDTSAYKDYHAHQRGAFPRSKTRLRTYQNKKETLSFLEVKRKYSNGKSDKNRQKIILFSNELLPTNYSSTIKVSYDRIQFWDFQQNARITVDRNITFTDTRNQNTKKKLNNFFILEIKKTSAKRCVLEDQLLQMKIRPTSLSKYCLAVAACVKEVKKNKYKKLLKTTQLWNSPST